LVRGFGWKGRRGDVIFKFLCLVQFFYEGEGRGGEGREYRAIFASPNWEDLEEREGKPNLV
jgi:hypothetical protein